MSGNKPVNITDDDFEEKVLHSEGITLVDFWAPWCGPCHQMAPVLDSFAQANGGKVTVFKVDADDNPKTAEKFKIRSLPTLIFFKNGIPDFTVPGTLTEASLQEKLDTLLGTP